VRQIKIISKTTNTSLVIDPMAKLLVGRRLALLKGRCRNDSGGPQPFAGGVSWEQTWLPGNTYKVDDAVQYLGSSYISPDRRPDP
jgi:hypothetical protein